MREELFSHQPFPAAPGDAQGLPSASLHSPLAPTRAFLVVTLTILTAEGISLLFGGKLVATMGLLHETMDITIIMALTLPCLYLFFARPMTRAIRAKEAAERSLRTMCLELDAQVQDRTALLEDLNLSLRSLSARLFTIQEEERKRVAQDLHDEVGQSLTAIKFIVERAMAGRCAESQKCHLDLLESAIPVIQKTVEEIRRICMALRPSTLDDLGLIATLKWFVREFQTTYPIIRTELLIDFEESEIPEALKTSIFRIVQEAMNNVAKHARSGRLTIALRPGPGDLRLTIQDDGAGFDPLQQRDQSRPGGFGLASMRERAQFHDGTLLVESAPGKGTTVTARWPWAEPPDLEPPLHPTGPR